MNVELANCRKVDRKKPGVDRQKHPLFDEYFAKHRRLIFGCAILLSRWFGGDKEEYIGDLTLRLNNVLYNYDPSESKFSTYFQCRLKSWFAGSRWSSDSEKYALLRRGISSCSIDSVKEKQRNKGNSDWEMEDKKNSSWSKRVIRDAGGITQFKEQVEKSLDDREFKVINYLFFKYWTAKSLAVEMKTSEERILDLRAKALSKIKDSFRDILEC